MKQTQRQWVEQTLKENGKITRNFALSNFVSRLGAIICDMKKDGWNIVPSRDNGDYVYTLVEAPKRLVWAFDLRDGVRVPRATYI